MPSLTIFGPPGTGKTHTLVDYAQEALERHRRALYLSYTKAAAIEATSRLKGITASTVHSLAFQLLGLTSAQVVDDKKLQSFSDLSGIPIMDKKGVEPVPEEGDDYLKVISYANHRLMTHDQAYDEFNRPGAYNKFVAFTQLYGEWKKQYGYVDFDDMLLMFVDRALKANFPAVLLDEAQDMTPLLWRCFNKIVEETKEIYLAGDDDQAIYEWNGADPHGMANFGGKRHVLDKSFRVPQRVHWLMHDQLLPRFQTRVNKKFAPADREGIVIRYGSAHDFPIGDFRGEDLKILTRDKFRQQEIARMLNAELIPYRTAGGFSPWTSKVAQELRAGKPIDQLNIGPNWREFYSKADLTEPVTIELSTIHQAKGKEARHVMVDCMMTNSTLENMTTKPDAELRVWYTACTRAAEFLYICGDNPCL